MCKALGISRGSYYYETKDKPDESVLEAEIIQVFTDNRKGYETRKIKSTLSQKVSRRKIGQVVKKYQLEPVYSKKKFKIHKTPVNESPIKNVLRCQFKDRNPLEAIVTDLTYDNVNGVWHYVYLMLDLFNREMIGCVVEEHKDAVLVKQAIGTIPYNCAEILYFQTVLGNEFANKIVDDFLEAFEITRSLSEKVTPYGNAVAESTYKPFKAEFIYQEKFHTLRELEVKTLDFVNWWNTKRIHGTLNHKTPAQLRAEVYV